MGKSYGIIYSIGPSKIHMWYIPPFTYLKIPVHCNFPLRRANERTDLIKTSTKSQ
jgi:hypothetical protein